MKNIIIEMKNTLDGINNRLNYTEEWIIQSWTKVEITEAEQKKKDKNQWGQFKRPLEQHQSH